MKNIRLKSFFLHIPPCVRYIALINLTVWFVSIHIFQQHCTLKSSSEFFKIFGLQEHLILERLWLWQFFTYMFLHASSILHVFTNTFWLLLFGSVLERIWGSRFFLIYYLFCGVGGGLIFCCVRWIYIFGFGGELPDYLREGVGASGALYGLILAFFIIYGRTPMPGFRGRNMKLFYILPFIVIPEFIGLLKALFNNMDYAVAFDVHLGGMLFGLIFLIGWKSLTPRNLKNKTT